MNWKTWFLTVAVLFAAYWFATTVEGTWVRWERFGPLTTSHLVQQSIWAVMPMLMIGAVLGAAFGLRRSRRTRICPIPLKMSDALSTAPSTTVAS